MLLTALLSLAAAASDWREFERRGRGWGETPTYYDAARIERPEGRVRVWIRFEFMLSGLPDPTTETRIELDCAGRRSRALAEIQYVGASAIGGGPPRLRRLRARMAPIGPGSVEEALARQVCPQG